MRARASHIALACAAIVVFGVLTLGPTVWRWLSPPGSTRDLGARVAALVTRMQSDVESDAALASSELRALLDASVPAQFPATAGVDALRPVVPRLASLWLSRNAEADETAALVLARLVRVDLRASIFVAAGVAAHCRDERDGIDRVDRFLMSSLAESPFVSHPEVARVVESIVRNCEDTATVMSAADALCRSGAGRVLDGSVLAEVDPARQAAILRGAERSGSVALRAWAASLTSSPNRGTRMAAVVYLLSTSRSHDELGASILAAGEFRRDSRLYVEVLLGLPTPLKRFPDVLPLVVEETRTALQSPDRLVQLAAIEVASRAPEVRSRVRDELLELARRTSDREIASRAEQVARLR